MVTCRMATSRMATSRKATWSTQSETRRVVQAAWRRSHGDVLVRSRRDRRMNRHKEPHGDVSHGDKPHGDESQGDVIHPKRDKSRGSGCMAAVAWRRVGSLSL